MNEKLKLRIYLMLSDTFSLDMPSRPAVTEIYANLFPNMGHEIIWISHILNADKKTHIFSYKDIKIIGIALEENRGFPIKTILAGWRYLKKFIFLKQFLSKKPCDILQVRNNLIDGLFAIYYKKRFKCKFVFQYSFPIQFNITEKCRMRYVFLFINWFKKIQLKFILDNSDLILSISTWMKNDLIRMGIPESKIFPLPMGVNPITFTAQIQDTEFRKKLISGAVTIILYLGTLSRLRRLEVILQAIEKVKLTNPDIRLLMVGDGDGKKDLENLCIQLGIVNEVIFTGTVPYAQIPRFISIADICLSPIPPDPIYMVSSPTKLFEYMIMKKPIVANIEIPEQYEVLNSSKCGLLVNFSSDSFAEGIIYLMKNLNECRVMGLKGYTWVIENRSYKKLADSVEKRYFELLKINK